MSDLVPQAAVAKAIGIKSWNAAREFVKAQGIPIHSRGSDRKWGITEDDYFALCERIGRPDRTDELIDLVSRAAGRPARPGRPRPERGSSAPSA